MSGDDIVERLRRAADTSSGGGGEWYQLVHRCREAADAIEARDAENERLRAEVERLNVQNATLRRNEWRLIWGLCTECGANRDKEACRG